MASAQCQKPSTTIEVCQPKAQHSSLGQKISEMKNKALRGYLGRHGNTQNQVQCFSQTEVESHGDNNTKKETHYYGQSQTQRDKRHVVSKTQVTVCVVQAEITQTTEYNDPPYGATTTCFGSHGKRNVDLNNGKKNGELNNKRDMNLFRRIRNGMSRQSNDGNSSSSSDSDSDDDKCPTNKASDDKCSKNKATDDKCPKNKNPSKEQQQAGCK